MSKFISIVVSFALSLSLAEAQDLQISGTVTDDNGETLPGVSVVIQRTQKGTITDFNGIYSINASLGDSVVFSSVGMYTKVIKVTDQTNVDVVLVTKIADLDEVIVVGYGTVSRASFVGATSVVKATDISAKTVSSVDKSLQGLAPGLLSSTNSGNPGSGTDIIIRGVGSINASTDPLYIIDGVPVASGDVYSYRFYTTNPLASLESSDIESISILKDAASTSIYGARASNGVIVITTKKGRTGKTKFEFNTQLGRSQRVTDNFEVANAAEYKELVYEQYINAGIPEYEAYARILEMGNEETNWADEVFRTGNDQRYSLKASGGDEKTNFYLSGNYFKQEGIVIATGMERYSARVNINHEASEIVSLGMNSTVSYANIKGSSGEGYFDDPITTAFFTPPVYPVRNADGTYNQDIPELININGVEMADENINRSDQKRYLGNFYTVINPLAGLSYKFNAGANYFNMGEETYWNPNNTLGKPYNGYSEYASIESFNWIITNTINYDKSFGIHDVDVLLGQEAQKTSEFKTRLANTNFPTERVTTLISGSEPLTASTLKEGTSLASCFSSLNYTLNKKYIIGLSARTDGSSRFGANNRWARFGSVGFSWRLTQEPFMKTLSFINDMKLRASYGTSGNQDILSYDSDGKASNDYYTALGLYAYGFDYNGQPGSALFQLPNPDLRWEKNQSLNIGLDFISLGSRLNGTVELYQKNTKDLIMWVPVSSTTGLNGVMDNVGAMQNRGIELDLNASIIDKTFEWDVNVMITANRNKVTELYNNEPVNDDGNRQRAAVGHPLRSFYLVRWAGVNPANGSALFLDEDGNPVTNYNDADKVLLDKSADPDFYGSFQNSFRYKSFDLSIMFYGLYGNALYNGSDRHLSSDGSGTLNFDRLQTDRWQKPGDITAVPIRVDGSPSSKQHSSRHLEDGSYLRLKNVSLSYTLPKQYARFIRSESLRLYIMGENLLTWTNFTGWDPESALDGNSFFKYPNAKTVSLGLDLTF